MGKVLKIAIVSDLHCMYKDKSTSSLNTYLYSNIPKIPIVRHPIYALIDMLGNKKITADYLLCPGDIANIADRQGLISGWNFLNEIKIQLNSKEILATIGNHDVDSRQIHSNNYLEQLKTLDFNFPLPKNLQSKFWSDHYAIYENDDIAILIFNSCYNHSSENNAKESNVLPITLDSIETDISLLLEKKYKIAMCHHHPIKHSNIDIEYKDGDVIDNGDKLLKLLDQYGFQVLIHGHKHDPRIKLVDNLHIFASGSFSSLMNIKELGAENCFHVIELQPNNGKGIIKTWIYAPTKGWITKSDSFFPCKTGFGAELSIKTIAQKINDIFINRKKEVINYSVFEDEIEDISYLRPDQQSNLNIILKSDYEISSSPQLPNQPEYLIRNINE